MLIIAFPSDNPGSIDKTSDLYRAKFRQGRVSTFAFTWCAYAIYYVGRNNFSVAKTEIEKDLALTTSQLGDIDTMYLIAYAIGQFLSGTLGDKIGGKRLVGLGLIAVALCNALFGVGQVGLFLVASWTANGLAQSTGWPGCAKAFSSWFATKERGTIMGLWCTCYQAGAVIATFIGTYCVVEFGWRWAFFTPALLIVGFAVLLLSFQKRAPVDEGLGDVEEYYAAVHGEPAPERAPAPSGDKWGAIKHVIASRPLWTLGLTYVVIKFTRYTFLLWLPYYMTNHLKYATDEAGYTSTVFGLAGLCGAVFAGVVSDRVWAGRRAPIVVIMLALLAGASLLFGEVSALGRIENIIAIAVVGFLIYGPDSVTSGVAAVDFGDARASALAAGFVNGLGSIGAALSGVVVGRVSAAYGWDAVFLLFVPLCLSAAALMVTLWRAKPSS